METFHVVIDTSVLRKAHFQHADFERLLRRSRKGTLRIYIPQIVIEERRTQLVEELLAEMDRVENAFNKIKGARLFGMLTEGLPEPRLVIWNREEIAQHSRGVFDKFLRDNKIEKLDFTFEHANSAWGRYFEVLPPFNIQERREERRKDIPDSWILEAALELKRKAGRHCALVADRKLGGALKNEGFEVYEDVNTLDTEIEKATAVNLGDTQPNVSATALSELRSAAFKDVDLAILGVNEALDSPPINDLFENLERAGIDRRIAEHEAQTLILSGVLRDSGSHYIPIDRELARAAAKSQSVTNLILKILEQ